MGNFRLSKSNTMADKFKGYVVDAFTHDGKGGNAAGVVLATDN